MKKIYSLLVFFGFMFLNIAGVGAASTPSYVLTTGGKIYANGTAIVIDVPTKDITGWTQSTALQNSINTYANAGVALTASNASAIMYWVENETTNYVYLANHKSAKIVAGAYQSDVTSTSVTINGGTVSSIYAGGNGGTGDSAVSTSVASASIIMNGGQVGVIAAGGFYKNNLTGKSTVTINAGTVTSNILAGSWNTANDDSDINESEINVNGGTIAAVYLHSYSTGDPMVIDHNDYALGTTTLNVAAGTIDMVLAKLVGAVDEVIINYTGGTIAEYHDETFTDSEDNENVFYGTATNLVFNMGKGNSTSSFEIEDTELPIDTSLEVEEMTSGTANYTLVNTSIGNEVEKFKAYDISLVSNNVSIQPDGLLTIKLLIPEGYNTDLLRLYHIADNGTKTVISFTVEGDYIVFTTNHLSLYVISERRIANPNTVDGIMTSILIGSISLIALFGIGSYSKKKRFD